MKYDFIQESDPIPEDEKPKVKQNYPLPLSWSRACCGPPQRSNIRSRVILTLLLCAAAVTVFNDINDNIVNSLRQGAASEGEPHSGLTLTQNFERGRTENAVDNTTYKGRYLNQLWAEDLPNQAWFSSARCAGYLTRFTRDDVMDVVWLASVMRSGNTWTRYLLEAATGIFTSSGGPKYEHLNKYIPLEPVQIWRAINRSTSELTKLGYLGENMFWIQRNTVCHKSHSLPQPWTLNETEASPYNWAPFTEGSNRRAIVIIRDPFHSLISIQKYSAVQSVLSDEYDLTYLFTGKKWSDFVLNYSQFWYELNHAWITRTNDTLIVHYETLKKDPMGQLQRMLNFLQVEPDPVRLGCLRTQLEGVAHNKKHDVVPDQTIYPLWLRANVWSHIHQLNADIKDLSYPGLPITEYSFANEFADIEPNKNY